MRQQVDVCPSNEHLTCYVSLSYYLQIIVCELVLAAENSYNAHRKGGCKFLAIGFAKNWPNSHDEMHVHSSHGHSISTLIILHSISSMVRNLVLEEVHCCLFCFS